MSVSRTLAALSVLGAFGSVAFVPAVQEQVLVQWHAGSPQKAGIVAVATFLFYILWSALFMADKEWRGGGVFGILNTKEATFGREEVNVMTDEYYQLFGNKSRSGDSEHDSKLAARKENYMKMVNHFYTLVTDFYEYGWGDSFHFANRYTNESHKESLRRAEYYLATRLGLNSRTKVLDVGAGIGGPMRAIARHSGATVVGINNCEYQIKVGERYNKAWGLDGQCTFLKTDFMALPVEDNSFDAAYECEATCHAPDKVASYAQIFKTLKPGGLFAGYEWCVTDAYDAKNPRHVALREGIEVGNGLPVIPHYNVVIDALKQAGFEVVDAFDMHTNMHTDKMQIPWYNTLAGEYSLTGFRMTPVGRFFTHCFVTVLELLRIAPKGSVKVSKMLNDTAIDLAESGKLEIFTPDFFFLARKPEHPKKK